MGNPRAFQERGSRRLYIFLVKYISEYAKYVKMAYLSDFLAYYEEV